MLLRGEERARAKRFEEAVEGAGAGAGAAAGAGTGPAPAGAAPRMTTDLTHQVATTPALAPSDPGRETFSERSDRLLSSAWQWTKARASALSPLTKLDEDEYVRRLEERLRRVEEQRERTRVEREELEKVAERLEEQRRLREGRE